MKLRLISLMVAVAFATPFAMAATPAADTDAARKAELAKARAELAESARRVAELSRGMDGETHEFRFETDFAGPPRVGIGIVMGTVEKGGGVRISAVSPEGPAAKAGLRAGDILTAVDGQAVAGTGEAAVQSARKLLADLEKGDLVRIGYTRAGKGGLASVTAAPIDRVMRFSTTDFPRGADFPRGTLVLPRTAPLVSPGVEMEIARIAAAPCADGDGECKVPVLAHAFRWNGLNLASVDAKLGRYFGTDRGVLVLSGGDALAALEPGDVIQKIDGAAVATPRDAMRALGEQDAGDRVDVVVLRDRKTRTVAVTVPEAAPLRWFTPPPPPAPPAPPAPPGMTAPPAPPAPPSPPDTPAPPAPPAGAGTAMFFLEAPPAPSSDATWTDENGQVLRIVSQQRTAGEGDGEVVERIVVSTAGTPAD